VNPKSPPFPKEIPRDKEGIFLKGSASWREGVVMPWAFRSGNSFTFLFEIKNIKDKTPREAVQKDGFDLWGLND